LSQHAVGLRRGRVTANSVTDKIEADKMNLHVAPRLDVRSMSTFNVFSLHAHELCLGDSTRGRYSRATTAVDVRGRWRTNFVNSITSLHWSFYSDTCGAAVVRGMHRDLQITPTVILECAVVHHLVHMQPRIIFRLRDIYPNSFSLDESF
jgi:hypothetical protein